MMIFIVDSGDTGVRIEIIMNFELKKYQNNLNYVLT